MVAFPVDSEFRRSPGSARAVVRNLAGAGAAARQATQAHADDQTPVIPPGQEDLMSTMLGYGATLPGDCTFAAGDVAHAVVVATYKCAAGDVVLEITHPLQAGDKAIVTKQFAISHKGGPRSPELAEAVATLVRTREAEFEWKWLGATPSPAHRPSWIFEGGLIALAAIALLGWALRRRSRRQAG